LNDSFIAKEDVEEAVPYYCEDPEDVEGRLSDGVDDVGETLKEANAFLGVLFLKNSLFTFSISISISFLFHREKFLAN